VIARAEVELGRRAADLAARLPDALAPLARIAYNYRRCWYPDGNDVFPSLEQNRWEVCGENPVRLLHEVSSEKLARAAGDRWIEIDPERLPAALVDGPDGRRLTITVPLRDSEVTAQIRCVAIGCVPLLLLDTDWPENGRLERRITWLLYVADPITRLSQYPLLGIGGIRALAAMGVEPAIVHLNKGHAAFAALELARSEAARGAPLEAALEAARQRTVFTTHTPVAAGNETYSRKDVTSTLGGVFGALGVDPEVIMRLGRYQTDEGGEPFGVTQFSRRMSRAANGCQPPPRRRRAGDVAWAVARAACRGSAGHPHHQRRALADLDRAADAPVVGPPPRRGPLAPGDRRQHLGGARRGARQRALERPVRSARGAGGVRQAPQPDRSARRAPAACGDRGGGPRIRLCRAHDRVRAPQRDVQAHTTAHSRSRPGARAAWGAIPHPARARRQGSPSDDVAKRVVQDLYRFKDVPEVTERVVFLHEYDLGMTARLVRGCDFWLNRPRLPLEASGTSGMKAVINGGLQLSVLEGWWAEAYDGTNGWALPGDADPDPSGQDARDATALYDLFERAVEPAFYDRGANGIPRAWLARVRASMRTLAPGFCTRRMLDDYTERIYAPSTSTT